MATAKDCHTLISYYEKKWKEIYNGTPSVNRITARWNFDSVLKGMSMKETKELIDYYFTTPKTRLHDLGWFFNNYDKLVKAQQTLAEDAAHRRKLMEESKIRAEQWRQSGRQGIGNN
jgi:hypothetical protein